MTKSFYWKDIVFPEGSADFTQIGPDGIILPNGTTAERPLTPSEGTIRYNSTIGTSEIYQGAAWSSISTVGSSGEINTASTLGSGQAVFSDKSGVDLRFKSLVAGTNVTIGSNSNEIIISAATIGEINTGANVGTGTGQIFESKFGSTLQFRTLISLNPDLTITTNGNNVEFDFAGVSGETNDATSTGTAESIFLDKLGETLRFRSVRGLTNEISVEERPTELWIGLDENPVLPGSESMIVPSGPIASEPAPINGMIRYNTTTNAFMGVINGVWETLDSTSGGGAFLPLTGGTLNGNLSMGAGASIFGSTTTNITLNAALNMESNASIDMTSGGNILMSATGTVDGRDLSVDGAVIDAINVPASNGILVRIGDPDQFVRRGIFGTSNQINVVDGDGVGGNPIISLSDNPILSGTESVLIPFGSTAQRPVGSNGMLRINTDDNVIEYFSGGSWRRPSTSGSTSISGDLDMSTNDIINVGTVDGRDLSVDGALIDQLNGITADTGVLVKNASGYNSRLVRNSNLASLSGIDVTNGDGTDDIRIGLDIAGMAPNGSVVGTDEIPVATSTSNGKVTFEDVLTYIKGEMNISFRASVGSPLFNVFFNMPSVGTNAVVPAVVSTNGENFNIGNHYDDGLFRFQPPAGIYQLTGTARVSQFSGAQIYKLGFLKNGFEPVSNVAFMEDTTFNGAMDGSASVTDIFEANGTDVFQFYIYIDGGSTRVEYATFFGHKVG